MPLRPPPVDRRAYSRSEQAHPLARIITLSKHYEGKVANIFLSSHCDTCKILGGGAYTMNQIIPKSQLKITSGGEPAKYTYYGDSGKSSIIPQYYPMPFLPLKMPFTLTNVRPSRQGSQLLLLPKVHHTHLPPPRGHGSRHDHRTHCSFEGG